MGTTQMMSRPSRRKNRSGSTRKTTTTSPRPLVPCPVSRTRVPSSVPGWTVIMSRFSTRTSPLPLHVGQRSEGTSPLPLGAGGDGRTARGPVAPAGRADLGHRQRDRYLAPERGDAERDGHGGFDDLLGVVAPAGAAPAEDRREQIAQTAEGAEVGKVEIDAEIPAGRPTTTAARPPTRPGPGERPIATQLIVLRALLGIAQHVVRLVDLLEALGRLRILGAPVGLI